jgi:hypothetical protein
MRSPGRGWTIDNQETVEGIRCSRQSLGLGVDWESRTVEASSVKLLGAPR